MSIKKIIKGESKKILLRLMLINVTFIREEIDGKQKNDFFRVS